MKRKQDAEIELRKQTSMEEFETWVMSVSKWEFIFLGSFLRMVHNSVNTYDNILSTKDNSEVLKPFRDMIVRSEFVTWISHRTALEKQLILGLFNHRKACMDHNVPQEDIARLFSFLMNPVAFNV